VPFNLPAVDVGMMRQGNDRAVQTIEDNWHSTRTDWQFGDAGRRVGGADYDPLAGK